MLEGPRPAGHRPDRHRQDRGLHAARASTGCAKPTSSTPFKSCRMLVLAPTRELAGQIADSRPRITARSPASRCSASSAAPRSARTATSCTAAPTSSSPRPGRLLDLIDQKALKLDGVEILVLDEADQMLDLGFIHALRKISELVPKERQTLFFSATMPKAIKELVEPVSATIRCRSRSPRRRPPPSGSTSICSWSSRTKSRRCSN